MVGQSRGPQGRDATDSFGSHHPAPLATDEAQNSIHRDVCEVRAESDTHDIDLVKDSFDELRPIAVVDVEPLVGAEQPADVTGLDLAGVLFGVDHKDPRWTDRDVIDVGPTAGHEPIVQHLDTFGFLQHFGDAALPLGANLPCLGGL